jgi:hypothetical protein
MTQAEVDDDQAGFINMMGNPFHSSRFPEGSELNVKFKKEEEERKKLGPALESYRIVWLDCSDGQPNVQHIKSPVALLPKMTKTAHDALYKIIYDKLGEDIDNMRGFTGKI